MRIYMKCQYCHHAVGSMLDLRGRHRNREEGQVFRSIGYGSSFVHLTMPYQVEIRRGGDYPEIYHFDCEEAYDFWRRVVTQHKWNCHLQECPHTHPYPLHRFNLPFNTSPTTLGDPIPTPEEVARLLRL